VQFKSIVEFKHVVYMMYYAWNWILVFKIINNFIFQWQKNFYRKIEFPFKYKFIRFLDGKNVYFFRYHMLRIPWFLKFCLMKFYWFEFDSNFCICKLLLDYVLNKLSSTLLIVNYSSILLRYLEKNINEVKIWGQISIN